METEVDFAVEAATEVEVEAEAEAVEVGLLQPVSITKLSNPIPSMFLVLLFMCFSFLFLRPYHREKRVNDIPRNC